jgi:hypothetical protein
MYIWWHVDHAKYWSEIFFRQVVDKNEMQTSVTDTTLEIYICWWPHTDFPLEPFESDFVLKRDEIEGGVRK